jgi:chromosome segregation ATPase
LGPEVSFDEAREQETADSTPTPTPNHKGSADVEQYEVKVRELTEELGNARRQLREQGNNFAEMERSFNELQKILPTLEQESRQAGMGSGGGDDEDDLPRDVVTLREVLREKNEKIKLLTAEFDAHRADFRSTIDTLEMASTETERVYEKRVDELLDEVRTLQDRSEDVESVAQQLKQLEELVQELEEGLEDARRGEAEARGEVEFLRGEVERSRSELRRERERLKTEEQLSGYSPANVQDLETQLHAKDDEIRGLKAIIQNLNETQDEAQPPKTNGNGNSARKEQAPPEAEEQRFSLQQQIRDLEAVLQQKGAHEEELANEVKQLRNSVTLSRFPVPGSAFGIHTAVRSPHSRGNSDDLDRKHLSTGTTGSQRTVVLTPKLDKKQPDWHNNPKHVRVQSDDETNTSAASASTTALWCEICEEGGHDILTCSNMFGQQETKKDRDQNGAATAAVAAAAADITDRPAPLVSRKNTTQPPPPQPLPPPPAATLPSPPVHEQPPPPPPPAASAPVPVDGMLAGRSTGVIDPDKWCALCERDGHDSVDCPLEDAF